MGCGSPLRGMSLRVLCAVVPLQRWTVSRQMRYEGGFQGRCNKLVDGCYSFWQAGLLPLLHRAFFRDGRGRPPHTETHARTPTTRTHANHTHACQPHTRAHRYTHARTDTHTQARKYTQKRGDKHTQAQIHTCRYTHTRRYTRTQEITSKSCVLVSHLLKELFNLVECLRGFHAQTCFSVVSPFKIGWDFC